MDVVPLASEDRVFPTTTREAEDIRVCQPYSAYFCLFHCTTVDNKQAYDVVMKSQWRVDLNTT